MQINFKAKKLKEANAYVSLLNPIKTEKTKEIKRGEGFSLKKVFNFLFR